jgi:hypothetical protein
MNITGVAGPDMIRDEIHSIGFVVCGQSPVFVEEILTVFLFSNAVPNKLESIPVLMAHTYQHSYYNPPHVYIHYEHSSTSPSLPLSPIIQSVLSPPNAAYNPC